MRIAFKIKFLPVAFSVSAAVLQALAQSRRVDYVNPMIGIAPLSDPEYAGNNPVPGEQIYNGTMNPGELKAHPVL